MQDISVALLHDRTFEIHPFYSHTIRPVEQKIYYNNKSSLTVLNITRKWTNHSQ